MCQIRDTSLHTILMSLFHFISYNFLDGYRLKRIELGYQLRLFFCFNDEKCFETASRRSYILLFIIVEFY